MEYSKLTKESPFGILIGIVTLSAGINESTTWAIIVGAALLVISLFVFGANLLGDLNDKRAREAKKRQLLVAKKQEKDNEEFITKRVVEFKIMHFRWLELTAKAIDKSGKINHDYFTLDRLLEFSRVIKYMEDSLSWAIPYNERLNLELEPDIGKLIGHSKMMLQLLR